jgi:hypothetical protein
MRRIENLLDHSLELNLPVRFFAVVGAYHIMCPILLCMLDCCILPVSVQPMTNSTRVKLCDGCLIADNRPFSHVDMGAIIIASVLER